LGARPFTGNVANNAATSGDAATAADVSTAVAAEDDAVDANDVDDPVPSEFEDDGMGELATVDVDAARGDTSLPDPGRFSDPMTPRSRMTATPQAQ